MVRKKVTPVYACGYMERFAFAPQRNMFLFKTGRKKWSSGEPLSRELGDWRCSYYRAFLSESAGNQSHGSQVGPDPRLCSSVLCWLFRVSCISMWTLESVCQTQKYLSRIWLGWRWIYRLGKNRHLDSVEPPYLWTRTISIYLIFLGFHSSKFCSFSHLDPVYIFLDLYLSISF